MCDVVASQPTTSRGKYRGPLQNDDDADGDGYGRMVVVPTFAFNTALRAAATGLPWCAEIVAGSGMNSMIVCKRVREKQPKLKFAVLCSQTGFSTVGMYDARRRAKESDGGGERRRRPPMSCALETGSQRCMVHRVNRRRKRVAAHRLRVLVCR